MEHTGSQGEADTVYWDDVKQVAADLYNDSVTVQQSQAIHTEWVRRGTFEQCMVEANFTVARDEVMTSVLNLFPERRDVRVLDVGVGTGSLGQSLREAGFLHIDALEPNREMLEKAKERGIYKCYMNTFFTDQPIREIENGKVMVAGGMEKNKSDSYELLIMCGVHGPGEVPLEAFTEALRVVKAGGYIMASLRAEYIDTVPQYRGRWRPFVDSLVQQGKWTVVSDEVYGNHYFNLPGIKQVFKKL